MIGRARLTTTTEVWNPRMCAASSCASFGPLTVIQARLGLVPRPRSLSWLGGCAKRRTMTAAKGTAWELPGAADAAPETSAHAAERAPGSVHSHAVAPDTLTCRDAGRAPPREKLERPLSITVTARTASTRSRLARARQPQVKGQTRRRLLERKLVGPNPVAMEGVGQTRPARVPPGTAS